MFKKDLCDSLPSSIFGFGLGVEEKTPEVQVDTWEKIIPAREMTQYEEACRMTKDQFYYPSDLWARILFNFAIAYRNKVISHERARSPIKIRPCYYSLKCRQAP